ncbi:hypothetical protein ETD86_37410 [Nonomuraea turkmeniaca]|uniref:Uncharacterized protein n=1 Tax=Nonomuraea turkmeniaca TaxID=103838 RepID=A0A5S4F4D1_9ACTN|nr:hypothetical protein [Nonomuraea turkmeniaca]TMR10997.1 hypothetical protein ETD86_37410 [Nonomuraea turkmeniaca]
MTVLAHQPPCTTCHAKAGRPCRWEHTRRTTEPQPVPHPVSASNLMGVMRANEVETLDDVRDCLTRLRELYDEGAGVYGAAMDDALTKKVLWHVACGHAQAAEMACVILDRSAWGPAR